MMQMRKRHYVDEAVVVVVGVGMQKLDTMQKLLVMEVHDWKKVSLLLCIKLACSDDVLRHPDC